MPFEDEDMPYHFMRSRVPLTCGKRLHASVRCIPLIQDLHGLQDSKEGAELAELKDLAENVLANLHEPCPLGAGEAVCVHGDLRAPNLMVRYRLGGGLYACAANLSWHVLALGMQASVLQSRCGALLSLVYCRNLQTQVDALGPPLLQQPPCSLHEASCTDACRSNPETGACELCVLDLGWVGTEGTTRYPASMNRTDIEWAEGATPRAKILKAHDQFMMRSAVRQWSAQASASVSPPLSLWRRRRILCKQPTSVRTTSAPRLSLAYHL